MHGERSDRSSHGVAPTSPRGGAWVIGWFDLPLPHRTHPACDAKSRHNRRGRVSTGAAHPTGSADLKFRSGKRLWHRFDQTRESGASPSCQRLIVLVRETQAVVQEAMEAFADGVIFKSSLGAGRGGFIQALETIAQGGVYYPNEIRRLGFKPPDLICQPSWRSSVDGRWKW